jgi:hypothetical protein
VRVCVCVTKSDNLPAYNACPLPLLVQSVINVNSRSAKFCLSTSMVTYSKNTWLLRNKVIIRGFRMDPILRQLLLSVPPQNISPELHFSIMGPAPDPSDVKLI